MDFNLIFMRHSSKATSISGEPGIEQASDTCYDYPDHHQWKSIKLGSP